MGLRSDPTPTLRLNPCGWKYPEQTRDCRQPRECPSRRPSVVKRARRVSPPRPPAVPRLDERALELAETLRNRVRAREAPLRRAFLRRPTDDALALPPPLASLLRGGRGGEVRLKVYLSLLWASASHPYDTKIPAYSWAELLALPDPGGKGARRIRAALHSLEKAHVIRLEARYGLPPIVYLQNEAGDGSRYTKPSLEVSRSGRIAPQDRYFKIPAPFWTCGWIQVLSGSAVAILLLLLDMENHDEHGKPILKPTWISPERTKRRYDLSPDTWRNGARQLEAYGLLRIGRAPVGEDFGLRRYRHTYRLSYTRLGSRVDQQDE